MELNTIAWIIVLASLVLAALGTVLFRNLLLAAVMLAVTSAVLTVALFVMGVPLAAVMELSVCAGLVTAVFATTISLTRPPEAEEMQAIHKERLGRYLPLPFIMLILAAGIFLLWPGLDIQTAAGGLTDIASRETLWDQNALDILGLALIILAGVLGVAVLFKERAAKGGR